MAVKILIKRKIRPEEEVGVDFLIKKLHGLVSQQAGYISGETFKHLDEENIVMVISTWKSLIDWERWANSPDRKEIEDRINVMLRAPTEFEIYENV